MKRLVDLGHIKLQRTTTTMQNGRRSTEQPAWLTWGFNQFAYDAIAAYCEVDAGSGLENAIMMSAWSRRTRSAMLMLHR